MADRVLLDLFCGAGGASMGYHRAGFTVVGVDIEPQPNYPFEFVRANALEFMATGQWRGADVIHASPPCQAYSVMTGRWGTGNRHPRLIAPVRALLQATGLPFVIENVPPAPLVDTITLCGSMFGLKLRRHRKFEGSVPRVLPPHDHSGGRVVGVYGNPGGSSCRDGVRFGGVQSWREAMGIDWMTSRELKESIPPAYTEFIGNQL